MEEYSPSISGKRKKKLLFELEKKESKKLKSCQKITRVDKQKSSIQSASRPRPVQVEEK